MLITEIKKTFIIHQWLFGPGPISKGYKKTLWGDGCVSILIFPKVLWRRYIYIYIYVCVCVCVCVCENIKLYTLNIWDLLHISYDNKAMERKKGRERDKQNGRSKESFYNFLMGNQV